MFDFLSKKFSGIFEWVQNKSKLTQEHIGQAITQVREALLDADVPLNIVEEFLAQVKNDVHQKLINDGTNVQSKPGVSAGHRFIKIVHERVLEFLGGKNSVDVKFNRPSVIMVLGLQGSGKTTTVAKLAKFLKLKSPKTKILCASIDFYRPAAIDQLEILSKNANIDFFRTISASPIDATKEIFEFYKKNNYEHLILDTAGRLHVDSQMLSELKDVNAFLKPQYKILVLDAMTGQESLNVAKAFNEAVGFDGAILTKMDSDARGGAAFAFKYAIKKSIFFVGSGEKIDDLEYFSPERIATRILGMGDILTLVEKTESALIKDEAFTKRQEISARRIISGELTLEDFLEQMAVVEKLGSLRSIMQYFPGGMKISPEELEKSQSEMKKFKAIISSMTKKEKLFPKILDASRKNRIALGSGTSVIDINRLLARLEEIKSMAKMLAQTSKLKKFF